MIKVSKPNPQIKRSKLMLRNALIDLLEEKAYDKISIADIAARADYSRTTFYVHYDTKAELIDDIIEQLIEASIFDAYRNINNFPILPAEEKAGLLRMIENWQANSTLFQILFESGFSERIIQKQTEIHKKLYKDVIRPLLSISPDEKFIDYFCVSISVSQIGVLKYWLSTGMKLPVDDIYKFLSIVTSPTMFYNLMGNIK